MLDKKKHVLFEATDQVNKELERLGIIGKNDHVDLATPMVYLKRKKDKGKVCTDFSTKVNDF